MQIKAFLPNPEGSDASGEFFVVENNSSQTQSLSGWHVKDLSGKAYFLTGVLEAGQEKRFEAGSKFPLNNNGETLYLITPSGEVVDELGYAGSALEGRLIEKTPTLTQEIKENIFQANAFSAAPSEIVQANNTLVPTAIFLGLLVATVSLYVLKNIPKSREEIMFEQFEKENPIQ
ncbi:MAG: lamin tail domain-containing protein [Candidatus Paceibacterota bacterium]